MANIISKHKYLLYLSLVAMLWDIMSGCLLHFVFPAHYLPIYPAIPIYFYLLNIVVYFIIDSFKNQSNNSVMVFLGSKIIKLLISIALMLIYVLFVRVQIIEFLIAFIGNYLFFLILDTLLMMKYQPGKAVFNNGGDRKSVV